MTHFEKSNSFQANIYTQNTFCKVRNDFYVNPKRGLNHIRPHAERLRAQNEPNPNQNFEKWSKQKNEIVFQDTYNQRSIYQGYNREAVYSTPIVITPRAHDAREPNTINCVNPGHEYSTIETLPLRNNQQEIINLTQVSFTRKRIP